MDILLKFPEFELIARAAYACQHLKSTVIALESCNVGLVPAYGPVLAVFALVCLAFRVKIWLWCRVRLGQPNRVEFIGKLHHGRNQ